MAKKCSALKRKHSNFYNEYDKSVDCKDIAWVDQTAPENIEELAVHRKKVYEVSSWFQSFFSVSQKVCPILLLTGPSGSGKTTTVKVICIMQKIELYSWSNTDSKKFFKFGDDNPFGVVDDFESYESQSSAFCRFLLHSAKYALFATRRALSIEEFPNALLRNPSEFHSILRKYAAQGNCPAVFIMSDNTKGDNDGNKLFPEDLLMSLGITAINFSPVAPTMLVKALARISAAHQLRVDKSSLSRIAEASKGDVRSAVNAMHFAADTAKTKSAEDTLTSMRDSSLFLFHALGKILYCKRNPSAKTEKDCLPQHLKHFERDPLIETPEIVYGKTAISADSFVLFLEENYLSFVDNVKDLEKCSLAFSEADVFSSYWSEKETLSEYAVSSVTRGVMFNLTPGGATRHWRSMKKPRFYQIRSQTLQLLHSLLHTFRGVSLSVRDLLIDLIPYISKIKDSHSKTDHSILRKELKPIQPQNILRLLSNSSMEETSSSGGTRGNPTCNEELSDEEVVIEEFDM